MAFDLYSGTFTRYYRRDWENRVQRFAGETGTRYQRVLVPVALYPTCLARACAQVGAKQRPGFDRAAASR